MKSPDDFTSNMAETVYTTNMAEALYLVQQGNRIIGMEMCVGYEELPRDECRFLFEGESAEKDHRYYISHNMNNIDLSRLPLLFRAASKVIPEARV